MIDQPTEMKNKLEALRKDYLLKLPGKIREAEENWISIAAAPLPAERIAPLHRLIHSLSGSSAVFGLRDLSDTALRLEKILKYISINAGEDNVLDKLTPEISHCFAKMKDECNEQLRGEITPPCVAPDSDKEMTLPKEGQTKRIKILIAEDDRSIKDIYEIVLSEEIFEKKFVDDGEIVLTAYNSWQPDILILDIMLPGKTGYVILKEIREEMEDRLTTIIMATSLSEQSDVLDCLKLGIQGYIVKPFNKIELSRKILECHRKNLKN
jgi:CheY-like chemotaxis protein/HPt (histidine-containing phosphotransfer) domain-containing protein